MSTVAELGLERSFQECRDGPTMCPMQAIHGTIESLIWTGRTGDGSPVNLLSPFPTIDGHSGAICELSRSDEFPDGIPDSSRLLKPL